jgi:hypothetical protein
MRLSINSVSLPLESESYSERNPEVASPQTDHGGSLKVAKTQFLLSLFAPSRDIRNVQGTQT